MGTLPIYQPLLVIPSIDIMNGRLVRVVQGIPKIAEATYTDDPVEMAKLWRAENAKCLHVVDFDGAWYGSNKNLNVIEKIIQSVVIPVQFGGGLRDFEKIKTAFQIGACRVVLGTAAVDDPDLVHRVVDTYGPERIIISLDILNNRVITRGRKFQSAITPVSLILNLKLIGVTRFIITDIERNGMMTHPNFDLLKLIGEKTNTKITASGGVAGV
ncbi:MAG: 1-(5-phosphoribosyl)-5-[(5-phosphoribosylamino)methylideneamino] imidazole-4-carboxamide isomerase, partial [Ignavibacteria bacterium]|nr:1-(5-phosphoribosyl)-5-[(5-phosphoribosylamino)methylideneamino] imidazole-4-carboxamide isomerase [Ignavibacteria bacterium]